MKSFKQFITENKSLNKHYKFSPEEVDTIENYTDSGYHVSMHDGLDKITKKHKTPKDMTLYFGISSEKEEDLNLKKGKKTTLPRFQSTTLSKKIAKSFGGTIVRLRHPANSSGAWIDHHSSRIVPEKEFLLPQNHRIRVTGTREENGYTIHDAESI
jgi:hypothetical protein